jgi:3-oxoacyl-[acyl-carrier protein] reductase
VWAIRSISPCRLAPVAVAIMFPAGSIAVMTTKPMRPVALVTGAGRRRGIATAIAQRLAENGWDVAFTHLVAYDARMPWGADGGAAEELAGYLHAAGARACAMEADFADVTAPGRVFDHVRQELGPVGAVVLGHCESVATGIMDTDPESFDRHFAVNTRAGWLLIREYARQFAGPHGTGRIIALTSDHTAGNLPYGASKGALDRIVIAAARELSGLGITANCINPGPTDNGWMSEQLRAELTASIPLRRLGQPRDAANLAAFLCSPAGGWVNGQLIHSDGGL